MTTSRGYRSLAGIVAGGAGLATSYLTASAMSIRESPVVAVAELVIRLTPGSVTEWAIQVLGQRDKAALVIGILVLMALLYAWFGRLSRERWWAAAVGFGLLAAAGAVAVLIRPAAVALDVVPIAVGLVTWLVALSVLSERLRRLELVDEATDPPESAESVGAGAERDRTRRGFLVGAAAMAAVAAGLAVIGRVAGSGRRRVEETRRLLRLNGVSEPDFPPGVSVEVDGVTPWMTSIEDFYLIDTAIIKPTIEPKDWVLRIHGLVEQEIVLTYEDLVSREVTESWITLNCVSNEIGGDLVGNAWWSGVRLADLIAEAGPDPEADAVLQTSEDGWTCGTPIEALTDDRMAMLALAMDGRPLPIEHGFPVRTIVPGLYGYVSACKWVVDMEVTKFSDITAYWTDKGWGEMGPVKMASRIDVPGSGDDVAAGEVVVAGVAWAQHTGIEGVEVAVDGESWVAAELARVPNDDTWVQWKATVEVADGDHFVRVRATDKDGIVQTGVERDVLPDGATGWHSVDFTASA